MGSDAPLRCKTGLVGTSHPVQSCGRQGGAEPSIICHRISTPGTCGRFHTLGVGLTYCSKGGFLELKAVPCLLGILGIYLTFFKKGNSLTWSRTKHVMGKTCCFPAIR